MSENKIETVVTYLEMANAPERPSLSIPFQGVVIEERSNLTNDQYLNLYRQAGEQYNWTERILMDREELHRIISDPKISIFALMVNGVDAGYFELDFRKEGQCQLAYFAIFPPYQGRKLGPYLLDMAIDQAWSRSIERFWVHTCDLDHPAALKVYQQRGFTPYKTQSEWVDQIPTDTEC